MHKVKI